MSEVAKEKPKSKGRPVGTSGQSKKPPIEVTIEGEYVIIKLSKKDLSRKLLADLI